MDILLMRHFSPSPFPSIDRDLETQLSVLLHPTGRTQQTPLCQPTLLHTQSLKTEPTFIARSVLLLPNFWFFALKGPALQQLKRASFGSAWSSSPMHCTVLLPVSLHLHSNPRQSSSISRWPSEVASEWACHRDGSWKEGRLVVGWTALTLIYLEGCRYAPVERTNRSIQGKKYVAKTKQTTTSFVS